MANIQNLIGIASVLATIETPDGKRDAAIAMSKAEDGEQLNLNPALIKNLMGYCFLSGEQIKEDADIVTARGIVSNYGFCAEKIKEVAYVIQALALQLPNNFLQSNFSNSGGGYVFRSACEDYKGELWTGEHRIMESLLCLGLASGCVNALTQSAEIPVPDPTFHYFAVESDFKKVEITKPSKLKVA